MTGNSLWFEQERFGTLSYNEKGVFELSQIVHDKL